MCNRRREWSTRSTQPSIPRVGRMTNFGWEDKCMVHTVRGYTRLCAGNIVTVRSLTTLAIGYLSALRDDVAS